MSFRNFGKRSSVHNTFITKWRLGNRGWLHYSLTNVSGQAKINHNNLMYEIKELYLAHLYNNRENYIHLKQGYYVRSCTPSSWKLPVVPRQTSCETTQFQQFEMIEFNNDNIWIHRQGLHQNKNLGFLFHWRGSV